MCRLVDATLDSESGPCAAESHSARSVSNTTRLLRRSSTPRDTRAYRGVATVASAVTAYRFAVSVARGSSLQSSAGQGVRRAAVVVTPGVSYRTTAF